MRVDHNRLIVSLVVAVGMHVLFARYLPSDAAFEDARAPMISALIEIEPVPHREEPRVQAAPGSEPLPIAAPKRVLSKRLEKRAELLPAAETVPAPEAEPTPAAEPAPVADQAAVAVAEVAATGLAVPAAAHGVSGLAPASNSPIPVHAPPSGGGPDRSRGPAVLGGEQWHCPFPREADLERIDRAVVLLRVAIDARGSVTKVDVASDPGFGFAREATRCAQLRSWTPALDRNGEPTAGARTARVHFER